MNLRQRQKAKVEELCITWRCVKTIHDTDYWLEVFRMAQAPEFKRWLMTTEEQATLAALPDPIPIFRGFLGDDGGLGLSWTTSRDIAFFFATRFSLLHKDKTPYIIEGTIAKTDVLAYFEARCESEIVCDPSKVIGKRVVLAIGESKRI
jgi:hypothetical protein